MVWLILSLRFVYPDWKRKPLSDAELICVIQVYGTTNLRVVDISVIPIHIAAHTHGMYRFLFGR